MEFGPAQSPFQNRARLAERIQVGAQLHHVGQGWIVGRFPQKLQALVRWPDRMDARQFTTEPFCEPSAVTAQT